MELFAEGVLIEVAGQSNCVPKRMVSHHDRALCPFVALRLTRGTHRGDGDEEMFLILHNTKIIKLFVWGVANIVPYAYICPN